MKTLDEILTHFEKRCMDGRDLQRLIAFVPEADLPKLLDVTLKPEWVGKHEAKPLTEENVITQLRGDVAFGFEKALSQRGISAGLMFEVVQMWNWILEDDLDDYPTYAQYGLPLFKAVALKYGFPNPIGDDTGSESKYAA